MPVFKLLIGGRMVDGDATMEVINPATEEPVAACARARSIASSELESDIMCALRCARVVLETAITNVGVNHRYLTDTETVAAQASRLRASVERYSIAAGSFEASSTVVI